MRKHAGLLVLVALAFAAGVGATLLAVRGGGDETVTLANYYCPMHPDYVSDVQGECPVCHMRLVPLEGTPGPPSATMDPSDAIRVPPERQQSIGLKLAEARLEDATLALHVPARVAIDERRIAHVHSRVAGFLEHVFVDYVGAPVERGQPLFTIYSPDILATQHEMLTALASARRLRGGPLPGASEDAEALVEAARRRLRLWGMTGDQIARVEQRGEPIRAVTIASPVKGIVTHREAFDHGRAVTPELDLYTIVDLSHVWVLAQVPEAQLAHVTVGDEVEVALPTGERVIAPIAFVAPTIDPSTRTATVRLDLPNPSLALKADMFVDVTIREELGERVVVPPDAVLDTGRTQRVFVDRGEGWLEPRTVVAGPLAEQGRVVLEGLEPGVRVVASATFLIDSESSLRGAIDAMGEPDSTAAPADVANPPTGHVH